MREAIVGHGFPVTSPSPEQRPCERKSSENCGFIRIGGGRRFVALAGPPARAEPGTAAAVQTER